MGQAKLSDKDLNRINDLMTEIFITTPQEGLPPPTVEDDGRIVLSYFNIFDEVFKREYT